jgi:ribosomal protein S12 methylthiotransferase
MLPGKRRPLAGIVSLGCSKNLVDTEFLMGGMAAVGWGFTAAREEADFLLINTCSFLDASVEEADEAIADGLAWKRSKPGALLVVAGCLVSRFGRELDGRYPGVDLFLLPGQIPRLSEWFSLSPPRPRRFRGGTPAYLPGPSAQRVLTSDFWAYLKISDGCDNNCRYCLIPSIRGRHRSRSRRSLVRETRDLIDSGVREINVIGQDITRWGGDNKGSDLPLLLESLAALPGAFRLRLLYLHPSRVDGRLRRLLSAGGKIFPYLDIPIQHAGDKVLRDMNRPYGLRRLEKMYADLRRDVPAIALRTTVMVGYPGEGKKEFGELLDFLRDCPFENLGAFVFSPQSGTAAAELPGRVPPEEAEERYHRVMSLQQDLAARLWMSRRGTVTEALIFRPLEGEKDRWLGRTAWQAPEVDGEVVVRGQVGPGDLVEVEITGSGAYDLEGVARGEAAEN